MPWYPAACSTREPRERYAILRPSIVAGWSGSSAEALRVYRLALSRELQIPIKIDEDKLHLMAVCAVWTFTQFYRTCGILHLIRLNWGCASGIWQQPKQSFLIATMISFVACHDFFQTACNIRWISAPSSKMLLTRLYISIYTIYTQTIGVRYSIALFYSNMEYQVYCIYIWAVPHSYTYTSTICQDLQAEN